MNDIIAIKSSAGSYFEVGKNSNGYYLKNRYTEIPNEFQYYDVGIAKSFFDRLCDRIPDCEEVSYPSGLPDSCIYVIYSDGTHKLLKHPECACKSLSSCAYDASVYSEFFPLYVLERSELLTLHHLRDVCREGKENFSYFLKAVKDLVEDDETDVILGRPRNGETIVIKNILGFITDPYITISEDGKIGETGRLRFVELLKKHNVRIVR